MKLETKLGLSTGGLIAAMFLSAATAHLRISDSNLLSREMLEQRIPFVMEVRDVRAHVTASIGALESYMLVGPTDVGAANLHSARSEQLDQAEQSLATVSALSTTMDLGEDAGRLKRLSENLTQLKLLEEKAERLTDARSPEASSQANALLQADLLPLERTFSETIAEVTASQRSAANTDGKQLKYLSGMTTLTLWVLTILGALGGGTVSIVLSRRLARSIDQLVSRANAIAEGDLTGGELQLGSTDQIGELAEAMNRMQTSLGGIIGTVADTAGSLTGSAVSMRSASDQIHRRIDQQSQQTQQAATAMQEMSASIAEVSRHTHSAAETARAAAQTARDGGAIVKEMLGSMHSIALAVTETSSTVGLLGEDSRRISQIVTVIDEIARKTNLLALNAAIEAARAGEQGRGFAVVAGEVRRLAESTAQATGEIATMIQEIQDRTKTAIASMASGTGTVEQGVVTTTQAGEALERIIGMAERVDRMITQIAIAAQQQATAADKSSASLDSIHTLSHENLTEMATTAAGIENLRGTAVTLEKQVDRFHIQAHPHYKETRAA